jgi:hypothetical protein
LGDIHQIDHQQRKEHKNYLQIIMSLLQEYGIAIALSLQALALIYWEILV